MMKIKITTLLFLLLLGAGYSASAQNVGISTDGSAPDNSAMLDIKSTKKGMLIPRMSQEERLAIPDPAIGLMLYQTDEVSGFYYNKGPATNWEYINAGGVPGPKGVQGEKGEMGERGEKGDKGGSIKTYHVLGAGARTIKTTNLPAALQPGMTKTFDLDTSATIIVWVSIGLVPGDSQTATADMILYVDGSILPSGGGWRRFSTASFSLYYQTVGTINTSFTLPKGTHTIELRTRATYFSGTSSIGADPGSPGAGEMTIMVLADN